MSQGFPVAGMVMVMVAFFGYMIPTPHHATLSLRRGSLVKVDIEMAYPTRSAIQGLVEDMLVGVWAQWGGATVERPFRRMAWSKAMQEYGSDKPDLRFGMRLRDLTDAAGGAGHARDADAVVGINARGLGEVLSKSQVKKLTKHRPAGTTMLAAAVGHDGKLDPSIAKVLSGGATDAVAAALEARPGDLLLVGIGPTTATREALGRARLEARGAHIGGGHWRWRWC